MANLQVTLVQIDNYGPWTVTPHPRREADLQTLQSRLFADLSQLFGEPGGYAFFARFDNMIAVSNGLDLAAHARIQESIRNRYPVTLSLSVASAPTAAEALSTATRQLQDAGSAQDPGRTEILRGEPIPEADRRNDDVQIAHFDVNDATGRYTDELHAFETFIHIEAGYLELMRHLHGDHDALSFFVGGDNVIAVGGGLDRAALEATIEHVEAAAGVDLKVGVGHGRTAEAAGSAAKHALEACRQNGTRVEGELPPVDAD